MKIIGSNRWGCGIHSPYVYSLVSRVIYGTEFRGPQPPVGEEKNDRSDRRYLDVTSRLIRFFMPGVIVVTGRNTKTDHLIAQLHPEIPVVHIFETVSYGPAINHEFVIWDDLPEKIPEIPGPFYKGLWILHKCNSHRLNFLMNKLRFSEKVSVTLNIQDAGIVIFNPELQKENFVIRRYI